MGGVGPSNITGDLSLTLAKLRRDNALSDMAHDPTEDEPKIVGIPKRYQQAFPAPAPIQPEPPATWWRRLLNRIRRA